MHAVLTEVVASAIDRARLSLRSLDAWAQHAVANPNVSDAIVCLTTTPTRLPRLGATLASVFAQRTRPRAVEIYVPTWSATESRGYDLPEWLLALPLVHVVRCHDMGPATKLLVALKRHAPDTRLLVIDDHTRLPTTLLEELTTWSDEMQNAIVGGRGACVRDDDHSASTVLGTQVRAPRRVDIVHGTGGYLVKPRFFDARVHDLAKAPPAVRAVDDVWFSAHASVPKWVVPLSRRVFPRPSQGNGAAASTHEEAHAARRHFAHRWSRS